jgi:hypothetical protein
MAEQASRVARFQFKLPEATQKGAEAFLRDTLDPQIVELQDQLASLQVIRRAVAASFGIDRRDSPPIDNRSTKI